MICPKCKELGQKSTVTGGMGTCTAMWFEPWYDEDGKYHNHDSNRRSYNYNCSKGHQIFVSPSNKCSSCDWGYEETVVVKDGPIYTNSFTTNALSSDILGISTVSGNLTSENKGE